MPRSTALTLPCPSPNPSTYREAYLLCRDPPPHRAGAHGRDPQRQVRTALALAHLALAVRLALAAALAAVLAAALAADCGLADLDLDLDLVEAPEVGEARRRAGFVSERREACRSRSRKQVLTWSVVSSQVLRL